mgnify:CR=1 FL=1
MKRNLYFLLSGLGILLWACDNDDQYPDQPQINYLSSNIIDSTDVLGNELKVCRLRFEFTDGDGDIGLKEEDTLAPFNQGSIYYNNLWVDYFEWKDSVFVERELEPPYDGRIIYLTPDGQNKTLIGTITYDMDISGLDADTFKLEVQLIDRALNESNLLVTPPILVN